jgi:hypothetical protein
LNLKTVRLEGDEVRHLLFPVSTNYTNALLSGEAVLPCDTMEYTISYQMLTGKGFS